MNRFNGQVVLVTGGGSGLGRAAAYRFAQEGAHVVVVDRDSVSAETVVNDLPTKGLAVSGDVGSAENCATMVEACLTTFGKLDVVFANAGIGGNKTSFINMEMTEWDRVINGNLRSIVLTCKAAVPALIANGGGAIVLMGSSTGGWDAIDGSGPYMTSKEAINALSRNLALELGPHNIRVNAICPGIIQTELSLSQADGDPAAAERFFERFAQRIPLGRVGQPEDVAATVAFLASNDARHVTGTTLLIDGGQTLRSWSNAPE